VKIRIAVSIDLDLEEYTRPPELHIYYNCQIKKGLLFVQWKLPTRPIDLAYMQFNMLCTTQQEYQWKFQPHHVQKIQNTMVGQKGILALLDRALSLPLFRKFLWSMFPLI
jgi:hypothetical protein